MGLFAVLFSVLLIGLKLAAIGTVASWSWWIVLLPVYGPPVAILCMMAWIFYA